MIRHCSLVTVMGYPLICYMTLGCESTPAQTLANAVEQRLNHRAATGRSL